MSSPSWPCYADYRKNRWRDRIDCGLEEMLWVENRQQRVSEGDGEKVMITQTESHNPKVCSCQFVTTKENSAIFTHLHVNKSVADWGLFSSYSWNHVHNLLWKFAWIFLSTFLHPPLAVRLTHPQSHFSRWVNDNLWTIGWRWTDARNDDWIDRADLLYKTKSGFFGEFMPTSYISS